MNTDLIRFIDSISRDKNIDKESIFVDLEVAMLSAIRKAFDETEDATVQIDRLTGEIAATANGEAIDMKTLGRIAAQTAKQVMIQKIREDERSSIFEEYSERVGTVVTGSVIRFEGGGMTVNLGRTEGFLPRSEMIPGDRHQPGERVRAMILNVREEQTQVKIVLTQTHPDYIRKLFELEVPEVGERIIEIRALAREAGYRTKVAVTSIDYKVDAVGACVGVRGSRIRNIVDELGGEKIDIVRWNESSQILITNSLKPAEVKETFLCFELGRATVIVEEDQLSLAIGKRGQNVRLAAQLTGWDIDILTPAEYNRGIDQMETALKKIEGVEDVLLDKMLAMGIISLGDLPEVGTEPLTKDLELAEALADEIVAVAGVEAKRIAIENAAAKKAAEEERKRKQAMAAAGESDEAAEIAEDGSPASPLPEGTSEAHDNSDVEQAAGDSALGGEDGSLDAPSKEDGSGTDRAEGSSESGSQSGADGKDGGEEAVVTDSGATEPLG